MCSGAVNEKLFFQCVRVWGIECVRGIGHVKKLFNSLSILVHSIWQCVCLRMVSINIVNNVKLLFGWFLFRRINFPEIFIGNCNKNSRSLIRLNSQRNVKFVWKFHCICDDDDDDSSPG